MTSVPGVSPVRNCELVREEQIGGIRNRRGIAEVRHPGKHAFLTRRLPRQFRTHFTRGSASSWARKEQTSDRLTDISRRPKGDGGEDWREVSRRSKVGDFDVESGDVALGRTRRLVVEN